MSDRTQAMTELAPGCCSASLPCNFQKEFPRLICDSCQIASLSSQLEESRKLCTAFEEAVGEDVGTILTLKDRIAELESNERDYEEIIGKKTFQEVADRIRELEVLLRPFAENADRYAVGAPETPDQFQVYVSLGDCRAASAALQPKDPAP